MPRRKPTAPVAPEKPQPEVPAGDQPVTRKSVAQAAGVSLTTVTHALNPPPGVRINPQTQEKVRRIAKELGYRPNFIGRALVSGKSYAVGVLQPQYQSMYSGFYQSMLQGLVQAMEPQDYHPLLLFRNENQSYLKVTRQGRIDALVILQSDRETGHVIAAAETGIPVVVLNTHYLAPEYPNLGCVRSDHARLMREVVAEFVSLGCRSILAIHDYRSCDPNILMFESFTEVITSLADQGVIGATLLPSNSNFRQQLRSLFQAGKQWDGIFVDGVGSAEILIEESRASGLEPGQDFRLITSDCSDGLATRMRAEESAYTHQPMELGLQTWSLLQALLAGSAAEPLRLVPYKRSEIRKLAVPATTTPTSVECGFSAL